MEDVYFDALRIALANALVSVYPALPVSIREPIEALPEAMKLAESVSKEHLWEMFRDLKTLVDCRGPVRRFRCIRDFMDRWGKAYPEIARFVENRLNEFIPSHKGHMNRMDGV